MSEVKRYAVYAYLDRLLGERYVTQDGAEPEMVLASDYEKLEAERNMWLETAHKAAHASGLLGGSVIPETLEGHITKRIAELEAENQRLRGWLNDKMVITLWSEPDSDGDTWPEEWEPALDLFHHAALEDTHE